MLIKDFYYCGEVIGNNFIVLTANLVYLQLRM